MLCKHCFLSVLSFLLLSGSCFAETLVDPRDEQEYETVKIGNQVWMAENLNYSVPNSWCYGDDKSNCGAAGVLYTWAAAMGQSEQQCGPGKKCSVSGKVQGVCPAGWHLPSDSDWETLMKSIDAEVDDKNYYVNIDESGDDSYGLALRPAGLRLENGTYDMGDAAAYYVRCVKN